MSDYVKLSHMTPTKTPSKCLLPHHSVTKKGDSSKIRVVFDAACRGSSGSLNDFLHVGPKLQKDLREILISFRIHKVVFVADIVKMYRNILLHPEDRAYQHIFWRSSQLEPIRKYELNTVTYGVSSAPFLALRVLEQLALDNGEQFPKAAEALRNDVYIDDFVTGARSVEEAEDLQQQLIQLLDKAGFSLSKWASNAPELLLHVAGENPHDVEILTEDSCSVKVLGLKWNPGKDVFSYSIDVPQLVYTKRSLLSTIARLFDPLGFLAPVILSLKAFIQTLWKLKIGWDEDIPSSLAEKWRQIMDELSSLEKLEITRPLSMNFPPHYQLIGFADASTKGYCACLYIRVFTSSGIETRLVTAKTRLAPVKTLTVPRLELCAALLLAQLYNAIHPLFHKVLTSVIPPKFFTDSTIVLHWLKTPTYSLKVFVSNRVSQILVITAADQWAHVLSSENPADCGSRGLLPSQLIKHQLWWNGPDWLNQSCDAWPVSDPPSVAEVPELKQDTIALVASPQDDHLLNIMERFSTFLKLTRTISWVIRFIHNCNPKTSRLSGPLTGHEIRRASERCIKIVQNVVFMTQAGAISAEAIRQYGDLSPFLDDRGIIRVGGRLKLSNLTFSHKHPVLLPQKTHFTQLVIDHYHVSYLHPGPNLLQALIRTRYWVPNLKRAVRAAQTRCMRCRKLIAKPCSPIMGDLPECRFSDGRPFMHVGLDFAGPFIIRESLRRKAQTSKAYLCLFVCMATKALHLELVSDLTTEAFCAALDRFISRRGVPGKLYSDCGSNFIGAANKLREFLLWFRQKEVREALLDHSSQKEIEWHFIPPHAPHFGGIWESGVKSVKGHLRKIVGGTPLTFEELVTVFSKIEAILNSRPLCALSSDPREFEALTPGHFLIGQALTTFPEPSQLNRKMYLLSRWQVLKRQVEEFWHKWRVEYLSTLQRRGKWTTAQRNLHVGDLVILKEDNAPPFSWPLARVEDVHPGPDGVVRVATVKTESSTLRRPVVKLAPLLPTTTTTVDQA